MKFSFDRSKVLSSVKVLDDGSTQIYPMFHPGTAVTSENVRHEIVPELEDSSTIVVDFGPDGLSTDEVVIGVGHIDNIQHIRHSEPVPLFF